MAGASFCCQATKKTGRIRRDSARRAPMRRPALACVLLMAVIPIDQPSVTTPPPVTAQFAAAQSSVGTSSDLAASLWAAMMEYQKVVHKERAADRKVARTDAKVEVALKSGKGRRPTTGRSNGRMEEAAEKAENMMDAADRQLQMGMIDGVASSLGALGRPSGDCADEGSRSELRKERVELWRSRKTRFAAINQSVRATQGPPEENVAAIGRGKKEEDEVIDRAGFSRRYSTREFLVRACRSIPPRRPPPFCD